jgi:uncharacterized protein YtpQ (UPF0354 family)
VIDTRKQAEIDDVREKISKAATSRDALTLLFVRLLELERPGWRFEMTSENELNVLRPDGEKTSIFLQNFWIECEQSPEERLEIVERRIRILAADALGSEDLRLEEIVPLIRDSNYREFVPADERDLTSVHLAGDIWIIYAQDLPDSINILKVEDAKRLGLDALALRKISINNLSGLIEEIEAKPYESIYEISCSPLFYASSLLLLDYVWEQLEPLVKGQIVVGVPARDTVIFTGSEEMDALPKLRDEVNYVLANGHHLISGTLLRRVDGGWEAFS